MISARYYFDDCVSTKFTNEGFRISREAMAWIAHDVIARKPDGDWIWYTLRLDNDEVIGSSSLFVRPILKGKNKGKPVMFRWNRYGTGLYRIKSKFI